MFLRVVYQLVAVVLCALALWCLVGGIANIAKGGLVLGVVTSFFMAVCGFVTWKFAVGVKEGGIGPIGVNEKALIEKEASLVRKPQKVAAK